MHIMGKRRVEQIGDHILYLGDCLDCDTVNNDRKAHKDHDMIFHPTQKPVDLMRYLVNLVLPPGGTILDPFMGSGTTGVACSNLARKFIGIDKVEEYFDIACRRIERENSQIKMAI